jgi:hypothetical protein
MLQISLFETIKFIIANNNIFKKKFTFLLLFFSPVLSAFRQIFDDHFVAHYGRKLGLGRAAREVH